MEINTYSDFVERAKRYAASRGLLWRIPLDEHGNAVDGAAWDIRGLVETREESAAYLKCFRVDSGVRALAVQAGWSEAQVAPGEVLSEHAQDIIKAAVVHFAKKKMRAKTVRGLATHFASFLSTVACEPWDLCTEDFSRFLSLACPQIKKRGVLRLVRMFNENVLSHSVPIVAKHVNARTPELLADLSARPRAHLLPDEAPLYELARIAFLEAPRSHADLLRFAIVRILYMTGFRIEEVRWLPYECLLWSDHVDPVTGKEAGAVGGVSRTLRLRYFGLKRRDGQPDVLVEDTQVVPERFQSFIVEAVEWVKANTQRLRNILRLQNLDPESYPASRHERFPTAAGGEVGYCDLLFLTAKGLQGPLSSRLSKNTKVALISISSVYDFVGINSTVYQKSAFDKYRRADSPARGSIKPHSLRHLMNTELFRHGVVDTIITKHFGRTSIAQSHEYDHRSLAEKLAFISLPEAASGYLAAGSAGESVAKMVIAGLIPKSHVATSFFNLQKALGDDAAFAFLAANADGFHVTPYGFCVNSFAMNPCARHLKCFDGCNQFAASGMQEHRINLVNLRARLSIQRDAAMAKPTRSVGRQNQVAHANQLIAGVDAALASAPGRSVFPDGVNHSLPPRGLLS